MRKILLLSSLLIFAVSGWCQDSVVQIRQFGGLYTKAGILSTPPNMSRRAHNIDLSRNLGSLSKRMGYTAVDTVAACDSIVGIYGAYYSDGQQQMVYVVDPTATKWGNVILGQKGSVYGTPSTISSYFSIQGRPSFAMLNDNIYIANRDQRGVYVNGEKGISRYFPMPAPGELALVPYRDSSGSTFYLSGEYRYFFFWYIYGRSVGSSADSLQLGYASYITQPIRVQHGRVLFAGFQRPVCNEDINRIDSMNLVYYRTTANPGALDIGDKFYRYDATGIIRAANGSGPFWTRSGGFANSYVIDSIPDTAIDGNTVFTTATAHTVSGQSNAGVYTPTTGAPGYFDVTNYLAYTDGGDTTNAYGVYYGIPEQQDTLGVLYAATFIDTITGVESDTGRSVAVLVDTDSTSGAAKPKGYKITLPRVPAGDTGLIINLYRAHRVQITYDVAFQTGGGFDPRSGFALHPWITALAVDTVVTGPYHLVGQYASTDTVAADSIRYDSLATKRKFNRSIPPPLMSGLFSYGGRVWGWRGSNLYFSKLDSAATWGAFDFIAVNSDDGDEITVAYPERGLIRVNKNNSAYNVYQDANGDWNLTEISSMHGCIASGSHVSGDFHYVLSDDGVRTAYERGTVERFYGSDAVSGMLDNFDKLSIANRRKAVGWRWSKHIGWTIGDTSYVWDELAGGWSTWSLKVAGSTKYGTEAGVEFIPGDSMYFFRPGDSAVYKFGSTEYDNGTKIGVDWISGPILQQDLSVDKTVLGIGLASQSSGNDTLSVIGYNHEDSLCFNARFSDLTKRYSIKGVRIGDPTTSYTPNIGLYYYLRLATSAGTTFGNTYIDAIDVYYRRGAKRTIE